jgi:hypothetical protein
MLAIHLTIAWDSIDLIGKGYPDFTIFYSSGSILTQGLGRQLYDEPTQYRVQQQFAAGVSIRQGPLPYNHPPFEALAFVPFSFLSYPVAYCLCTLFYLMCLVFILRVLLPSLPGLVSVPVVACLFIWVAFFPIFFALLQGQDVLLLVLLFSAVYVLLRKNSDIAAGCCLALGLFRFHLTVPLLLILLWQQRSKAILGFLSTAAVLGLISIAIVGWQGALSYPGQVLQMERAMELHQTIFPLRMANIRGLLASLLPIPSRLTSNLVVGVFSLGLLLFAIRKCKWKTASQIEFDLSFSLCVIVTVLVSYHTLPYDLSLLLLPIVLTIQYLFRNENSQRRGRLVLLIPLFILFFSPLHAFLAMRAGHYNLFALVLLFWCWALYMELVDVEKKLQQPLAS